MLESFRIRNETSCLNQDLRKILLKPYRYRHQLFESLGKEYRALHLLVGKMPHLDILVDVRIPLCIDVPIHIHRAGHDNYSRGKIGIDLYVLSKIFRLGGADLIHTGPVFGNLYDPEGIIKNVRALADDWFDVKKGIPILSRSANSIVQDSIDYLGTDSDIKDPTNVLFLVDKDVYQYADTKTGSIIEPTKRFVETVRNAKPNRNRTKQQILKNQGYKNANLPTV